MAERGAEGVYVALSDGPPPRAAAGVAHGALGADAPAVIDMSRACRDSSVEHGSNCIFDDTEDQDGSLTSSPACASNAGAASAARSRWLPRRPAVSFLRRSSTHLTALLGTDDNGTLHAVRKALAWTWLAPLLVAGGSVAALALGSACLVGAARPFDACTVVMLPGGVLLPLVALAAWIYSSQPSKLRVQDSDFFSDALLSEMLSGENILDLYTVVSRGQRPAGSSVIVFLSGVGGVPETWQAQVEAVVDAGFPAIMVQLPGSGALGAVRFSFARASLVVSRVLEAEVFRTDDDDDDDDDEAARTEGNGMPGGGVETKSKVVLVAWGLSCHVAMHLASPQRLGNNRLAGIVLYGAPDLPSSGLSWYRRLRAYSFRVAWVAELARLAEYRGFDREMKRVVDKDAVHPEARADWANCFSAARDSLCAACAEFNGPVLALASDGTHLLEMQQLWGTRLARAGSNLETVYIAGLRPAGFTSYLTQQGRAHSRHLVQFARAVLT